MTHVREELTALVDGALEPGRRATVEEHLSSCASCRAERDRLAAVVAACNALPAGPAPSPGFEQRFYARLAREKEALRSPLSWLRRGWRWAVLAAGLSAAAAAAVAVLHVRADRMEMAEHLDLLENYVVVASLDSVESAEDVEVVIHLDELRGAKP
ncbi:MAG TPA: zf-HC2 domain-containing protein [Anaeromyxobacteraceae bacterium]|nr:zf-HC2 domain-containing protein [Anaeromyxobacteraceae bacterium]